MQHFKQTLLFLDNFVLHRVVHYLQQMSINLYRTTDIGDSIDKFDKL